MADTFVSSARRFAGDRVDHLAAARHVVMPGQLAVDRVKHGFAGAGPDQALLERPDGGAVGNLAAVARADPVRILQGYRSGDGLWDVEGELIDRRAQAVVFPVGGRRAGEAIHCMRLRLTVDATGLIKDVGAASDAVPFEGVCGAIAPRYRDMIGVRVGPGYGAQVSKLLGGTARCTHMTELLLSMGTAVLQTLVGETTPPDDVKPINLVGCHALVSPEPVVASTYPRWYRPKPSADTD